MQKSILLFPAITAVFLCLVMSPAKAAASAYLDSTGRDDALSGGVKVAGRF